MKKNNFKTLPAAVLTLVTLTSALYSSPTFAAEGDNEPESSSGTFGGFGIHGGINFSDFDVANSTYNQARNKKVGPMFGIHFQGIPLGLFGLRLEAKNCMSRFLTYIKNAFR